MAKSVLVIEDEPTILCFVKDTLELEGYTVATWDNGRGAWNEITRLKPSLLILDLMLPGFDGYSLLLKISQDPVTKDIPVIVMTAEAAAKPLFDKFSQVIAFLKKPFKADELLAAARRASAARP
jgi:CheY-like chemotaxis protein